MLRCDHATPLLLLYHAMPHCFRVGVSILSPLSAYSPPPTLLASISRLPWLLAAWLANRWMHRPSDKQFWRMALISRADCIVEFIKDLFLPSFVGFFFEKKWIRLALWTCTKMSSNSEIFDKCPAWFIMMSVWYLLCYLCCCSLFTCSESVLSNISFAKCDS